MTGTATIVPPSAVRGGTFRSLGNRNYRLYFIGQLVSVCGTWMQATAQAAYIQFVLGGKGRELGRLSLFTFLPILLIGMWAGAVTDRLDRRRLLIYMQGVLALIAAVQTAVVASGAARIWIFYALAACTGTANAFEMPARQTFVTQLVGPEDLPNAVGLNSSIFNSGRLIGPAIGGVLVNVVGYSWCFALNAASFGAILIGLVMMRASELYPSRRAARAKGQVREGIRHVRNVPVLATVLLLVAIFGTLSMNFQVFLPLMAKEVFRGGPRMVGLFQSMIGVGSLTGALLTARRSKASPIVIISSALVFGISFGAFALSRTAWLACVFLIPAGYGFISFLLACNTTLQLSSAPSMRGRVMALYSVMFAGSTPIGAPSVGWVADHVGERQSVLVGATGALVTGLLAAVAYRRGRLSVARPQPNGLNRDSQ